MHSGKTASISSCEIGIEALKNILAELPADNLVTAFFINHTHGANQLDWMDNFAPVLKESGFITIGILSDHLPSYSFHNTDYQIRLSDLSKLESLERVDVFLVMDIDCTIRFPDRSKVIGQRHGFYPDPFDIELYLSNMLGLDALLIHCNLDDAARIKIQEYWKGFIHPNMYVRKFPINRKFYIIPAPYLPYALEQETLTVNACDLLKPDSIIYAPILADSSPQYGGNRIARYGERIIECLLSSCPKYNVIFRPTPNDRNKPEVTRLIAAFGHESRFLVDKEDRRTNAFSRGAVLVTDFSNIARSFAIITGKPAIRFQPWQAGAYNSDSCIRVQTPGVVDIGSFENLRVFLGEIRDGIYNNAGVSYYKNKVVPLANAMERVRDIVLRLCHEDPSQDWEAIERKNSDELIPEVELIQKIMKIGGQQQLLLAALAVQLRNRTSRLLLAFALHLGRCKFPDTPLPHQMSGVFMQLTHIPWKPLLRYSSIKAVTIESLYKNILTFYHPDSPEYVLANKLLSSFRRGTCEI